MYMKIVCINTTKGEGNEKENWFNVFSFIFIYWYDFDQCGK